MDLKKNSGDDRRRAKELFIALSCSDLFMTRVKSNQSWTLFDAYDTPDLCDLFGAKFEERYLYYETLAKTNPEVFTNTPLVLDNVKDQLWKKIQTLYFETGNPFFFFKDATNRNHRNPELGIIRSSNLCTEFMNPVSGDDELAVCNLGSLNLSKLDLDGKLNINHLEEIIPYTVRFLDSIVDLSSYPTPQAKATQQQRRSIGLGICGEADLMARLKIHYGTNEHLHAIDTIYGTIERLTINASEDLAREKGPWNENSTRRNAYLMAIAPTSSIGIIMDTTPMHEPVFKQVWVEDNKLGTFKVTAPNISAENYEFFKSVYDYDQQDLVRATARRQKYFDMGISHNLYFDPKTTTGKYVYDTIMLAWELGLLSLYYCRTGSPNSKTEEPSLKDTSVACFGCAG